MVIVFFGTPQFAVPTLRHLLASKHELRGVVTQPDKPRGRGRKITESPVKAIALEHGVPVYQPERLRDPEVLDTIAAWNPDLGVVAAYGKLIPEALLKVPRFGMVNVHASLLPKYRGAAPVHRAIIDGEQETGVTVMRVVKALDAGDMIAKKTRPIGPHETSEEVERDLAEIGARLLVDVVNQMEAGQLVETPQDASRSTYAPRLTKDEGLVDWSLSAGQIHNRVRGLYPWPHAYTYLDGSRIILLRTRVVDAQTNRPPGTVIQESRDAINVATGLGGVIAIEELQSEGRRPMRAREFLAGHPLRPGVRFTAP